jgi:hypothetical protein
MIASFRCLHGQQGRADHAGFIAQRGCTNDQVIRHQSAAESPKVFIGSADQFRQGPGRPTADDNLVRSVQVGHVDHADRQKSGSPIHNDDGFGIPSLTSLLQSRK